MHLYSRAFAFLGLFVLTISTVAQIIDPPPPCCIDIDICSCPPAPSTAGPVSTDSQCTKKQLVAGCHDIITVECRPECPPASKY
ncbi:hypothetical protein SISSUDRAFT_1053291 [Sistotremastrum suecicum HHB10207 ss-3]|uniref:Extracellular membrane protein CFEM domain-containing protein n=1 Tax=Sistotremastrum suecicum HHB10207 ss-3 TaxID=1314776 RepID=A0A165ZB79_9AGAM|nr:hypothetical protein SISSUDRAFT_1053291 [Sistotremastrum suecicum HHB10207 ss-3]